MVIQKHQKKQCKNILKSISKAGPDSPNESGSVFLRCGLAGGLLLENKVK